jgi:RNA polymerase sigma-70 factor (ECF subfamily)
MEPHVRPEFATPATARDVCERDEILAAQLREPAACRALIVRHQRSVGSLLRRMLAGTTLEGLTEDLAQETFLRAFAALHRFDPDGPARLSTWLLTIATRLALQAIERRRIPAEAYDDMTCETHVPADELAPDRARLGEAIANAVSRLPPGYRAAFVLREFHGFEYGEIARSLQIDIGTVKSRLWRARAALQRELGEVERG